MDARDARRYVEYVFWVRDRILSAATGLPAPDFTTAGRAGGRDLRGTLVHELESEWAWRIRLATGAFPEDGLAPDAFPSLASLASRWSDEERLLRGWLETVDDAAIGERPPGRENTFPRSDYLMQLVVHAVQQFSDAAVRLSELGRSPGNIDYIAFCNERG